MPREQGLRVVTPGSFETFRNNTYPPIMRRQHVPYGFNFRNAPRPLQGLLIKNGQNVFKNRLKTCFQTFPVLKRAAACMGNYSAG
jgi:hypothetical protein